MKLHSLRLTAFRQHADSFIEFGPGITGIIGSNGAGKSTILEAIEFALFGFDAIRGTKGNVRWHRAPGRRQAEVELEFSLGGTTYLIQRQESGARIYQKEGRVIDPLADGTTPVNAFIPTLLGMNLKEFRSSYLCSQKDLTRIASMGGTERQTFYRNVMGVGKVDDAVKAARQSKNDLTRERDGLAAGLGEREPYDAELLAAQAAYSEADYQLGKARLDEEHHRDQAAQAEERLAASEAKRQEAQALSVEWNTAEVKREQAEFRVESLKDRLALISGAGLRLREKEPEIRKLPEYRKGRDHLIEMRHAAQERVRLQARIDRLTTEISGVDGTIDVLRAAIADYDGLKHTELRASFHALSDQALALYDGRQAQLNKARAELAVVAKSLEATHEKYGRVAALGEDGPCPTCTRVMGKNLSAVVATIAEEGEWLEHERDRWTAIVEEFERETESEKFLAAEKARLFAELEGLSDLEQAAKDAHREIERLVAEAGTKTAERSALHEDLQALPTDPFSPEALAKLEATISHLESEDAALATDRALAGQQEATARDLDEWQAALLTHEVAVAEVKKKLDGIEWDRDGHDALARAMDDARRVHFEAAGQVSRLSALLEAESQRVQRAEAALTLYDKRAAALTDLTEKVRVASEAAIRLHDFRVALAAGIRPELQELVSGFVAVLTDGRFEAALIDEEFGVTLHRGGLPVEVVSGGEEDVVALSMRLATSQMIAERAGQPLSLLVLDEPFGSQDEVRRSNMMALFRRLQGVFPQIVLISHVPEIQNEVDAAVFLTYDEAAGCTRVETLAGVA